MNYIEENLKSILSEKRFEHCQRVANIALKIAETYGANQFKAYNAALLHDCAKEKSNDEVIELCKARITLGDMDYLNIHELHGIAGAVYANQNFGIDDDDILIAIACHAGRPGMGDIEKIVMASDMLDKMQRQGHSIDEFYHEKDLNNCLLKILKYAIQYCIKNDIDFAERTQDAFDYIIDDIFKKGPKKKQNKTITLVDANGNKDTVNLDELEEKLLINSIKINKEHKLNVSLDNMRDIGGYETVDGKAIKKHMLVRSMSLNKLTKEDAYKLKDYGIKTIIDLRDPIEIKIAPDANIEDFEYYNCPLPIPNPENEYFRQRLMERKLQCFTPEEDIWYNYQYFKTMDMLSMYKNMMFAPESIKQLKKIFKLIMEKEGILFHCTSGKDRTGTVAMLLEIVLDVCPKYIRRDYYGSLPFGFAIREEVFYDIKEAGYGLDVINEAKKVLGLTPENVNELNKIIIEKYGSTKNYIHQELKLTEKDFQFLAEKYLK